MSKLLSMRERSLRVDITKLQALSDLYRSTNVAKRLNISKQRWHLYKIGENDLPESMVDRVCDEFKLNKAELVKV